MKKIAKFVFKIHRKMFGYPMISEVRLCMDTSFFGMFSMDFNIGLLYICGESIDDIAECLRLEECEVKRRLNRIVEGYKW